MDDNERQQAFMSALVTEHFALQSTASSTISESSSRASLYLLSLSSSLVALGFATQASRNAFAPFAAAVLPTMFLLGWFTMVRLVDTSIVNAQCQRRIAHIHSYYANLVPEGKEYFPSGGTASQETQRMVGIRPGRFVLWFTMAAMIAVVNAVLGGTMIALLLAVGLGIDTGIAVALGVVVAGACAVAAVGYEQRRFDKEFPDRAT
jgi:hypothetical protein